MIPTAFQSRRVLKWLNVGGVGCALAAIFSAFFALTFGGSAGTTAIVTGLPTWILGTAWALLLRWPKTVGKTTFRWGWVASAPLAALNAAIAAGMLFSSKGSSSSGEFAVGMLLGATVGAIVWIPSLIATLLGFGAPIAYAQRLAKKGLAGEERGEWIVGLVCLATSLAGLAMSVFASHKPWDTHPEGIFFTIALAAAGMFAGSTSAALALLREARRRKFVADAEAGKVKGYRVDPTDEGKVLVRIQSHGEGYRVADFEEELYELDAQGEATQPKHMELTREEG